MYEPGIFRWENYKTEIVPNVLYNLHKININCIY